MAFDRWGAIPEIQEAVSKLEVSSKQYSQLVTEGSNDSKVQARKLWVSMSELYWDIVFALVDTQTQSMPPRLYFDEEERLFIDLGCLPGTLDLSPAFDAQAYLSAKCSGGILPVMTFSDYITESWASIMGNRAPASVIGPSLTERVDYLSKTLEQMNKLRGKELIAIASAYAPSFNARQIDQIMTDMLLPSMKVQMRAPEYREGTEASRQKMNQQRKIYREAENAVLREFNSARKNEANPLPAPKAERYFTIHEATKTIAREILYLQNDSVKIVRRMKKIAEECAEMPPNIKRGELRKMLTKKREYLAVPAKNARTDTSLLCQPGSMPIDCVEHYKILESLCRLDIQMFDVPRVRMHGLPRAIFVPGRGLGTYDWSDNSILLPMFPTNGEDLSVSYALGTFRWDSDEDRFIKTPYEQIKDNKKKSITAMASSFYRDYSLWLTKEKKGYRILPGETHKAFVQIFKPKADN